MTKRLGLLLLAVVALSAPSPAEESLGLKFEPLPKLERRELRDSNDYAHFVCKTEQGPVVQGLYPELPQYPEFQAQEAYSSPNGAFPNSHKNFGGPADKPDPGPLPTP